MKFPVLLIFCVSVQSYPMAKENEAPFVPSGDEIGTENDSHYLEKKPDSDVCPNLMAPEDGDGYGQPSKMTFPRLMTLSNEEPNKDIDVDKVVSELIYKPDDVMLFTDVGVNPVVPPWMLRAPLPRNGIKDISVIQDPTMVTSKGFPFNLLSYLPDNSIPSVHSLPPVSLHIHESLMDMDNHFETDGYNTDINLYGSPNVRLVRSREDKFLELLEHDAMIPNIIPTMPIPYVREADAYQVHPTQNAVLAFYSKQLSDCSLPLLFGCNPLITFGSLSMLPHNVGDLPTPSTGLSQDYLQQRTMNQENLE